MATFTNIALQNLVIEVSSN